MKIQKIKSSSKYFLNRSQRHLTENQDLSYSQNKGMSRHKPKHQVSLKGDCSLSQSRLNIGDILHHYKIKIQNKRVNTQLDIQKINSLKQKQKVNKQNYDQSLNSLITSFNQNKEANNNVSQSVKRIYSNLKFNQKQNIQQKINVQNIVQPKRNNSLKSLIRSIHRKDVFQLKLPKISSMHSQSQQKNKSFILGYKTPNNFRNDLYFGKQQPSLIHAPRNR